MHIILLIDFYNGKSAIVHLKNWEKKRGKDLKASVEVECVFLDKFSTFWGKAWQRNLNRITLDFSETRNLKWECIDTKHDIKCKFSRVNWNSIEKWI